MNFRTDEEGFWAGAFGDNYIARNEHSAETLAAHLHFFARSLRQVGVVKSCVEFGANVGLNLRALQVLYPGILAHGVEINALAARKLATVVGDENVSNVSIYDYSPPQLFDLSICKGVLIHLNPELLPLAYEKLVRSSRRWIFVSEYYNPEPVEVSYRGHEKRLYKRDFAGELLAKYPSLALMDFGFAYRHDPTGPKDDTTWFLLENRSPPQSV